MAERIVQTVPEGDQQAKERLPMRKMRVASLTLDRYWERMRWQDVF